MTTTLRTLLLAAALALVATPAFAQRHVGIRAGVSADPDQFVFGGHVETKPLARHVTFRPNVEVGVGDNVTLVGFNIEFVYSIPLEGHPWRLYLGGGPAAVFRSIHNGGGSDVGGGFNFLVGAQHSEGLFVEFKAGAIDSPSAKFLVGYAFR